MTCDIQKICSAQELAIATQGQIVAGDQTATCLRITTDSREPQADSLFIALSGENFDGAKYCADAVAGGSKLVLVSQAAWEQKVLGEIGNATVVTVADTQRALGDLAAWHRKKFPIRLVAITGSNGKTSTKEMTTAVLGGSPTVHFNRGNFNNLIGMPRALLGLNSEHQHAVMEMGMNAPGEIARLAEIADPQVGLVTNVHPVHLEGLKTLSAVAQAKGELFAALPDNGTLVLNLDDPLVVEQTQRTNASHITFGRDPQAEVRVFSAKQTPQGLDMRLTISGREFKLRLGRPGLHNAVNAAAAAAVGVAEGIAVEKIIERLEQAPLPAWRMEQVSLGELHLLVDCYNANPKSTQAAIDTLVDLAADLPRYAILGDMRELGQASDSLHQETGKHAAKLDGLCAFGPLAKEIATGARAAGLQDVFQTEDIEAAIDWAKERMEPECWMLLKGSRAMRLERVAASLARLKGVAWGQE
jgi:UDP-N-acetylmuramoyl-tripeptide--D-alanyl-D-alanine ligase